MKLYYSVFLDMMQGPDGDTERVLNTHVIINDQGEIVSTYAKTHLFDIDIKGNIYF